MGVRPVKRNHIVVLGHVLVPSQLVHTILSLRYFTDTQAKWEKLYAAHKDIDPRQVGTRRLMLIPSYFTTNQTAECPQAGHTLLNHYYWYKISNRLGHTVLRALICCIPLCLTKQYSYPSLLHAELGSENLNNYFGVRVTEARFGFKITSLDVV